MEPDTLMVKEERMDDPDQVQLIGEDGESGRMCICERKKEDDLL